MSVTPPKEPLIPRVQAEYIIKSFRKGERIDGRGLQDYRSIDVVLNPIEKAEGSALVKLGNTQALTGVKVELGEPFPDRPGEGVLQVHAEFVPLASPTLEPGPPDEDAIETARIVDRALREPKAVKMDALVVEPGKLVFVVFNDIYLLDHFGNVIDASMISSMLALAVSRLPKLVKKEAGEYFLDYSERADPLPINTLVTTVTMGIYEDNIIVDPSLEEESVLNTFITIAVDEAGRIVGMQKRGSGDLSRAVLDAAVDVSLKKGREVIELMRKILNTPKDYMKPLVE